MDSGASSTSSGLDVGDYNNGFFGEQMGGLPARSLSHLIA
jgi:hypothetical protein